MNYAEEAYESAQAAADNLGGNVNPDEYSLVRAFEYAAEAATYCLAELHRRHGATHADELLSDAVDRLNDLKDTLEDA